VRQIITSQELVSEVEIISGIPSIPFAISGTVVTRASTQRTQKGALKLTLKSSGVQVLCNCFRRFPSSPSFYSSLLNYPSEA
jgi:hypothetical protein